VHDEIRSLRAEIEMREFKAGKTVYVLGEFARELARLNPRPWTAFTVIEPLFQQLNKKHGKAITDDVYWWLVVLGVLRFKDIEDFTGEGWNWDDSVDYVEVSVRGAALMNQMKEYVKG
jgi:hypothetical protein